MEEKHFLAFDCGATSCRAVLGRFADGGFSMEELYRFPNQILESEGRCYWDIGRIYAHSVGFLSQLGQKGIRVDSIGIDTWGVDFGCIGPEGELLGMPRAYRDPYTRGVPERVFATIPRAELYGATGIQIMDFNTIFQLYAQTAEGDSALAGAESILFMPDLLAYLLTGNRVCEYTDASTSGMMDQASRQFNTALLERLGIRTDVPLPIVQPGTPVGVLKPELAEETGLGPVPVIAVAGHDTASAIAAVPAADEKFAYLSSGTWSLMGIEVPAPIINEASAAANFTNEGGIVTTAMGSWWRWPGPRRPSPVASIPMIPVLPTPRTCLRRSAPHFQRRSVAAGGFRIASIFSRAGRKPERQSETHRSSVAFIIVWRTAIKKCSTCCRVSRRSPSRNSTSSAEAAPTRCSTSGRPMRSASRSSPDPPKPLPSAT